MPTNKQLEQKINTLEGQLSSLTKEISQVSELLAKLTSTKKETPPAPPTIAEPVKMANSTPIPQEYLNAVKTTLNDKFGVQVNALPDRPAFEFVISVPKEYSNASPAHWQTYKGDFRPKVISDAEGLNGVKDWLNRIWNNFNQDTKTLISLDRSKAYG